MREEISAFLNSQEKFLIIPHKGKINTMQEWHKLRGCARVYKNYLVCKLINYLPGLAMKSFACKYFLGMKIGKNVSIGPDVIFDPFYPELITIGDNSIVGWNARLLCHEFTERHTRIGRITIGSDTLIGAFSVIRSGIEIGSCSVVAMDSLVVCDIPSNELWMGVPARRKRKLSELI